jgi:hypothetical protein
MKSRFHPLGRALVYALLSVAALSSTAHGQGFGVGIIAGNPTGVSVKKWLPRGNAIDGAAAWSFDGRDAFQLHADYLWHHDFPSPQVPFYCGLGGRVGFYEGNRRHGSHTRAGVRFPLGLTWLAEQAPVDVFVEVVPVFDVAPRTDLELDAAIGIRYYFR